MTAAVSHIPRLDMLRNFAWGSDRRFMRRLAAAKRALVGFVSLWAATAYASENTDFARVQQQLAHMRPVDGTARDAVTHVIVLGDSISQGEGAESVELSYASLLVDNVDDRYPEDAGEDLRHHFGEHIHYINVAHTGDTTYDVVSKQLPKLLARLHEDARNGIGGSYLQGDSFVLPGHVVVVMTAGGNDVQAAIRPDPNFTGATLSKSLVNLRTILDTFADKQHFPGGASAYMSNVYDLTDGEDQFHLGLRGAVLPGFSKALDAWSRAYAVLARDKQARLIDSLSLFRGHGFNFANPANPYFDEEDTLLWLYDRDCIHPNNLGHHMLRRAFLQQIQSDFP